ncbi:hypothetical protein KJZ71_04375 [Patescibacteria group bacterium]|uniref:Uncharacterized protein n=1 Tax=candidate division WWE3 bacterium TaxID=2053526 RepID=A0A928TV02_UNCKA|nr:hypothetical protein [candidate division WWE3 bacterium]MCL4733007.1 hypothetical protein [Patescibacteria group bacterium]MDL1953280.1 hypothetical protein [Candidatus Uhrbacteria bacterium UHB]RIL00511.1 MAG: hypothetical protein DCC77_03025 [Candidatus Uhrbacteria bacterium]
MSKFDANKLALAGAITAALCMMLLSILNGLGLYQGATNQMMSWHMYYSPTVGGTVSGMVEAAVITYVVLFVFAWVYNALGAKK